ncbi:hypothetical protein AX15_007096 [Amanita polypyramis BW_CC]|nr:hypothetical protein AX15_007096 [Amanita polypyramis BW_CC]
MTRWDSPLFTVMWSDKSMPYEDMWEAITKGNVKPPNMGTAAVAKMPAGALHALERTTTSMVSSIMSLQATAGPSGGIRTLTLSEKQSVPIELPEHNITLAELQRVKRQFIMLHKKAITLGSTEKGEMDWNEERIAEKFVKYLGEHVNRPKH